MRPRTRVVALSHVQFSCGLRMPIRAIAEVVHRAGALLLVDGAQGAGQMAVDVHSLEVDFYAISGQKWLLGPQGTGALYVAREHARIVHPLFTTHALADEQAALAEAAGPLHPLQRFRVASQSTGLVAGFGEAVRLMQSLGFDTIEERANELAGRLRAGLAVTAGCTLIGPRGGSAACALVAVSLDGWKPPSVVEALWGRWRIAARAVVFPPAVRFSTHVFNTEAEIDATLEAVGILAKEGPPREPGPT
jgi:L-cysteine/cystine lyase